MNAFLTGEQTAKYAEFQEFAAANVEPFAGEWDRAQKIPAPAVSLLGQAGYLGASIPRNMAERLDVVTFGLLNEALGEATLSFTGVLTVQAMVSTALLKWGTDKQRRKWLPLLAKGEVIGAFALTEPGAGSAIHSLTTGLKQSDGMAG